MRVLVAAYLDVALLSVGLLGASLAAEAGPREKPLTILARTNVGLPTGSDTLLRTMLVRSRVDLKQAVGEHAATVDELLGQPAIDFAKYMVVCVSGGDQRSSGYWVDVRGVSRREDRDKSQIVVRWSLHQPTGIVLWVRTTPAELVLVERAAGEGVFRQVVEEAAEQAERSRLEADGWKELLNSYQKLALHLPPPDAPLMALLYEMVEIEDRERVIPLHRPRYLLGFLLSAEEKNQLLVGTELIDLRREQVETLLPVKPDGELPGEIVIENDRADFPINAVLPTAIQCFHRGWHDLAARLLKAHEQAAKGCGNPDSTFHQPAGVRPRLAIQFVAWAHLGNALAAPTSDRALLLKQFEALSAGEPVLQSPECWGFIRSLAATVKTKPAVAGSVGRAIDDLIELDAGLWGDAFMLGLPKELTSLARRGWEAVPVLIDHLDDRRLTRSLNHPLTGQPRHLASVGEIVCLVLHDMAGDEGRSWRHDERGRVVVDDVRSWWQKAQQKSEEEYLLGTAIPQLREVTKTYRAIIERLSARYPQRLGDVYRRLLSERPDVRSFDIVAAIVDSELGPREKIDLLCEGVDHPSPARQAEALEGLATVDPPLFERLQIKALKGMPATTPGLYAECEQVVLSQQCWNTNSRDVWHPLRDAVRRTDVGIRMEVIGHIADRTDLNVFRRRRVAEMLLAFLDDDTVRDIAAAPDRYQYAAGTQWPKLEVRNWAAYQLGRLWNFDLAAVLPGQESPEAWQRLRGELIKRAEELRYLPELPTSDERLRAREALRQAGVLLIEEGDPHERLARRANLAFTEIKNADLRYFRYLPEIEVIDLTESTIVDDGLKELAACRGLRVLKLTGTKITDAGMKHLAAMPRLGSVDLMGTAVTDAGLAALADCRQLESLTLTFTKVTDDGMQHLAKLPKLQRLYLYGLPLTDRGVQELARIRTLTEISLNSPKVTDVGLKALAELAVLEQLYLSGSGITDAGMPELARLKNLTRLDLSGTAISDQSIESLLSLPKLERVVLADTKITAAATEKLRAARPSLQIVDGSP